MGGDACQSGGTLRAVSESQLGADASRVVVTSGPVDLGPTLSPLVRGRGDPTARFDGSGFWRATRTPEGPATLWLRSDAKDRLRAAAWGPGSTWVLDRVPELVGDRVDPLPFLPRHPLLRELARRHAGVGFPRTGRVLEALVPSILEQKVTGDEARAAYKRLVRRHGEIAPGPAGLMLPPHPDLLAALPYYSFHPLGIEARRAMTIRRAAARAPLLEEAAAMRGAEARARLRSVVGVGAWTAAEVTRLVLGDPDAVSVGDYHVPHLVCWALAGERRGDDRRMLELLEPYRGHRARVVRLLEVAALFPPRRVPRAAPRAIAAI